MEGTHHGSVVSGDGHHEREGRLRWLREIRQIENSLD